MKQRFKFHQIFRECADAKKPIIRHTYNLLLMIPFVSPYLPCCSVALTSSPPFMLLKQSITEFLLVTLTATNSSKVEGNEKK